MTRLRDVKRARRNGRLLTGVVGGSLAAALFSLYLVNKQPDTQYETAKQNAQIQEVVKQPTKGTALVQNKPASSLEKKVLSSDKKVETKKTQTPATPNIPYNAGVVVCSNQNYLYAQLNLEVLKDMGYTSAFMQEIKVKGSTYYRTIVGTTNQNLEAKIKELKEKDLFGMAGQYFRVWGKDLSKFSKETPVEVAKRTQKMENEFVKAVDKLAKNEFSSLMAPFIDKSYNLYTRGKNLPASKISEITGYMYDAAKEFRVPLAQYSALVAHEGKFTNKKGDTKYKYNYSEGYGQIQRKTQEFILENMKKEGIKDLPEKLPSSIIPYEKLQFRMIAWYFGYCLKESGWNGRNIIIDNNLISKATSKYNRGHNSEELNKDYIKKVQEEKERIIGQIPSDL